MWPSPLLHVDAKYALHLVLAADLAQPIGLCQRVTEHLLLQKQKPTMLARQLLDELCAHGRALDGAILRPKVALDGGLQRAAQGDEVRVLRRKRSACGRRR